MCVCVCVCVLGLVGRSCCGVSVHMFLCCHSMAAYGIQEGTKVCMCAHVTQNGSAQCWAPPLLSGVGHTLDTQRPFFVSSVCSASPFSPQHPYTL